MYIDYFNKKAFKLKMASYNDGKILHLDVTDADAPIKCRGCGSIKLKSLGGKTGTPGIYYDANVSPNGTWKFLYVTYHHNRGYQCQECNKKMRIKSKIPCKKGISADLRKQIVEMLVLDPSDKKRTWAKLIEEYTITDFKGTQVKGVENTTIQLLTKSRISRILKDYVEECERLIRGYALQENVIFHPFIYEKQTRGVVISCDKLDCTAEEQRKCTIDGFCDRHSAETLYKLLLDRTNGDVSSIQKILMFPLILPQYKKIANMSGPESEVMYKGIDYELLKIHRKIVKKERKDSDKEEVDRKLRNLDGRFHDYLEFYRETQSLKDNSRSMDKSAGNFRAKINDLFLEAESEWGNHYTKLKDSYQGNEYEWYKNVMISKKIKEYINKFERKIKTLSKSRIGFRYIPARLVSELYKSIPPIQNYFREMESQKNPTSLKMSFSCGKASVTMQRPVSDELFILPIEKSYFVIVGFDDMSYCGYDILEGSSVELLIQHLVKLTMWEKAEIKTVYCRFDPELVYDLRAIFQKAEVLVDLEEVVHAFADDHIRTDEVQLIIATAVHVFDPDPASVGSRYPDWVTEHRPTLFQKIQPSPQKLLEISYCTEEELDQLFEIYSRVSLAPELLERYFTRNEIRKKYKDMEIFQSLAEQGVSAENYAEKVKNEGLPTCIETPKDLRCHRVLMAYEDVEIDLEGFLKCLDGSVERPDIAPS